MTNSVFNDFQPDYGTEEENTALIEQVEAQQAVEDAERYQQQQQMQPQEEASTEAPAQQQQTEPKTEGDGEFLGDMVKDIKPLGINEDGKLEGGGVMDETVHGVVNTGIGLINMIPGVEIPRLPKYADELKQAESEVSGVLVPMVFGLPAAVKGAKGLAAGNAMLSGATATRLGTFGLSTGYGAAIDYASDAGEGDTLTGSLKQNFPKTLGWLPDNIATMAHESPDIKRKKNAIEGIYFGAIFDSLGIIAKYALARKDLITP